MLMTRDGIRAGAARGVRPERLSAHDTVGHIARVFTSRVSLILSTHCTATSESDSGQPLDHSDTFSLVSKISLYLSKV